MTEDTFKNNKQKTEVLNEPAGATSLVWAEDGGAEMSS